MWADAAAPGWSALWADAWAAQGLAGNSSAPFAVVLAIGQSNAMGEYATKDALIDTDPAGVSQWGANASAGTYQTIFQAADPLAWNANIGSTTSPATWLARSYTPPGARVLIVPCAIGATAMVGSVWQPGNPGGSLYENAITQANAALTAAQAVAPGSYFAGAYWVQGEADGGASVSQATYAAALKDLIAGLRTRITGASSSWFLIGQMPYETMQHEPWAGTRAIHYAHKQVGLEVTRCKFVPGPRGYTVQPGVNRHYTAAGVRLFGAALAGMVATAAAKTAPESLPTAAAPSSLASSSVTASGFVFTWAAPNADTFEVELSSNGGTSWAPQNRTWGDTASHTFTGLAAGAAYKARVRGVYIGAASAWAELDVSTQFNGYNFEVDTVGAAPANVTLYTGGAEVGLPGVSGSSKALHSTTTNGAGVNVALWAKLTSFASAVNQRVTWRRHRSAANVSRDGMVLRVQDGTSVGSGYTGGEQGYWFSFAGTTGQARIFSLGAGGPTGLATNFSLAEADTMWFSAEVNGSTLTFQHSPDGTNWTTMHTLTNTSFAGAGGVAFFSGAAAANPSAGWVDEITQTIL